MLTNVPSECPLTCAPPLALTNLRAAPHHDRRMVAGPSYPGTAQAHTAPCQQQAGIDLGTVLERVSHAGAVLGRVRESESGAGK